MELNQISSNINVEKTQNFNQVNKTLDNKEFNIQSSNVRSDVVSLGSDLQRELSLQLNKNLQKVSNIQSIHNNIQEQHNTISKLEYVVEHEISNSDAHTKISSLINSYNNTAKTIYSNLNEMVEDINSGESRVYFDGVLGSRPLSPQEINEAVQEQKESMQLVNEQLDKQMNSVVTQSQKLIVKEKEISSEQSSFKDIDFGKESADFSSNNIHAISSSISSAHTNPLQSYSIRLLS